MEYQEIANILKDTFRSCEVTICVIFILLTQPVNKAHYLCITFLPVLFTALSSAAFSGTGIVPLISIQASL